MSLTNIDPTPAPANKTQQDKIYNPNKWISKYEHPKARNQIRIESIYLLLLLFLCPVAMLFIWMNGLAITLGIPQIYHQSLVKYALAWVGGTLGGILFSMKWLYHSVANFEWIQDRFLWRFLTPHLSGALSFAIITLISSGIMQIFDKNALNVPSTVVGLSFLCGYFSDNAIAKMTDVADTLFGTLNPKKKNSIDS